jgi:transcriptional regulator with AAA-type ATPase domain
VRCDASPEDELVARLFGREGRTPGRRGGLYWPGAFERARGGTVVIARLDAAPPGVVVRLRAALAEGKLLPVSGDERSMPEAGVIATARDPRAAAVTALSSLFEPRVDVPPLRDRRGDAEDLFWHFARASGFEGFPAAAATHFASLEWPGNVSEFRHAVSDEIERCLGKFSAPGRDRAWVEARTRASWTSPRPKAPPPGAALDREKGAPKKKRRSKKDKILEVAARVAAGELTPEDAARLSGATVSYTKRVLRKGT